MRKELRLTIESDDRDKGKTYVITEMPATQAEKWAARALFSLGRAGVDVPDDVIHAGWAGIVAFGYRALGAIRFEDAEPLMDEMMTCIKFLPGSGIVRELVETDTEEIATRYKLRLATFELHAGFSIAALLSASNRAAPTTGGNTPTTSISTEE